MSKLNKEELVSSLRSKIGEISTYVKTELENLKEREPELLSQVRRASSMEQEMAMQQLIYTRRRIDELSNLSHSPFFAKIVYKSDGEVKSVYISKYEFSSSGVSSWAAPIAELRFENLGASEIRLPKNVIKKVNLSQKDSYVINDEKIIYYSQETIDTGVEIIYEDFLSNIKSEYGLSEIISKIEKEQYKIIQSKYNRPLIVSGPAGSGKTTICLHRISYLLQTPETSDKYAGENMLMLVQDKSAKDYFSSILPKLGIANMYVYTFFEWATEILDLNSEEKSVSEINLYNIDENYLNLLKDKVKVISKNKIPKRKFGADILEDLTKVYDKCLSAENYDLYSSYKNKNQYDYLDMTIMLSIMTAEDGLCREEEVRKSIAPSKYKIEKKRRQISYGLVMVDEFQNYTSDQINIIQRVIDPRLNSLVYIGDPNQKSILKPESDLHSDLFSACDRVTLDKVYRNTKNILEYIQSAGYDITIPDKARDGQDVIKIKVNSISELQNEISSILETTSTETVGILFDNQEILSNANLQSYVNSNIRIMTKIESQGTEFGTVISINGTDLSQDNAYSEEFVNMKKFAKKNADYIGYTRAVERLYVVDFNS